MTDNNPTNPENTQPDQSSQPKPHKRKRWPFVLLGLFLVVLALIALAPTIAGMGPVRSFVLGKVNENLNGSVEIADWSVGWFSPTTVTGVKVYDEQKRLIVDIPQIKLGLSLLAAARNNFALGDDNVIEIDSFIVHLDEKGQTNLEKLPRVRKAGAPKPVEPKSPQSKLPNVSGKFTVNFKGTIEGSVMPVPVQIDPSTAKITIIDINQPIESAVKLAYHVGERPSSVIETSGSVATVKDNILDIAKLAGGQKIDLKNVDLAAMEPVLKKLGVETKIAGIMTGGIEVKAEGLTGLSANGEINIAKFMVAGGALGAGSFQTPQISIPVKITRSSTDGKTNLIKFENVGVKMQQASVSITGEVSEQALMNLSQNKPPGVDSGSINITFDVTDLKDIASQLKDTIHLQPGVSITGGTIHEQLTIALTKDQVRIDQNLKAEAQGMQGARAIVLKPIVLTAGLSAIPTGKAGALPDFHDLKLSLASVFATFNGGGASLAKVDLNGNFDLGKLHAELSQFADMSGVQLQGTGDVAIKTNGDVTDPNALIDAEAKVNLLNVKVGGVANQSINQDRLSVIASGKLLRKDNSPVGVDKGYLSVIGGDPNSPALIVEANAILELTPGAIKAPWWEIKRIDAANLALLQQQYGGLVPALAQRNLKVEGQLHVQGAGSFDGTTAQIVRPLMLSIGSLTVSKNGKPIVTRETISANLAGSVTQAPDRIAANLSALSLTTQSNLFSVNKSGDAPVNFVMMNNGAFEGSAAVAIAADLQRLSTIAQSLSGETPSPDQPQLRGGKLNATITLAHAAQVTVDVNGQVTGLTVFTNGNNAIENEQITLALNATAASDFASAKLIEIKGKVGSSFVNATLADVKIASQGGVYDMLQSANLDVQAPDLAKLSALADAFSPAKPQAATPRQAAPVPVSPPLQIAGGGASIKATVSRDASSKVTTVNVSEMQLSRLALNRGQRQYAFDRQPISMKLNAAIKADKQIDSIEVKTLSGDARIATIEMPQPITIKDPLGAQPSFNGQIKVAGNIQAATPLLSVLQDADPLPYQGAYQLTQQISTKSDLTTLSGAVDINAFKVLGEKRNEVVFTEDQVAIRNDIDVDMVQHNARVKTLTMDMPKSKALGMKLTAQMNDWVTARNIKGLDSDPQAKLDLTYDLEKLWAIAKPMLSPEMQAEYKALAVKGAYTKTFTVSGAYPDKPFNQAIASMNASGSFALDLLDLPQGLTIKAFEMPFAMKNGVVQINPAPRSDARRITLAPPPARRGAPPAQPRVINVATAIANDGALALDQTTIDLTQTDPLLSIISKHPLLRDVKLNPVLADNLGKLGAMIMTDAKTAEGLATVIIVKCDKLPLGELIQKKQNGEAQITLAVDDLVLDGPVPQVLSSVAQLGTRGINGTIPTSTISIKNGRATTDLTVQIDKQVQDERGREVIRPIAMKFAGGVGLEKLELHDFTVSLPPELMIGDLRKVLPNGAVIPLKGTASKPQLEIDKLIRDNAIRSIIPGGGGGSGKGGDILDQLLGGGKNEPQRNRGQ